MGASDARVGPSVPRGAGPSGYDGEASCTRAGSAGRGRLPSHGSCWALHSSCSVASPGYLVGRGRSDSRRTLTLEWTFASKRVGRPGLGGCSSAGIEPRYPGSWIEAAGPALSSLRRPVPLCARVGVPHRPVVAQAARGAARRPAWHRPGPAARIGRTASQGGRRPARCLATSPPLRHRNRPRQPRVVDKHRVPCPLLSSRVPREVRLPHPGEGHEGTMEDISGHRARLCPP